MVEYYDTQKIPSFTQCRFLASGNCNWDYFLSPTCPYVYYISKVSGCVSGGWGSLEDFLSQQTRTHRCVDYILPIPVEYHQCSNPPVDTNIPPYKRPMPCCPQQRIRAYGK